MPTRDLRSLCRSAGLAALTIAMAAASAPAWCDDEQKKQPPPEFSSGYHPLQPTTPYPRAEQFAAIDVVVLLAALAIAAYLILTKRSRSGIRALSLFSLLYFGFYRGGCVCAVGSLQNVALALGDGGYALPLAVGFFFVAPLVFALFFGRAFCAAVCPLGAAQDLVLLRPRRVPASWDAALSLLPYIYLGAAVLFAWTGSAFVICQYDPFVGFFRMSGPTGVIAFGALLLLISTVIGRPYCRFLCPYGVLLRWLAPLARWRVHVAPTACVNCHLCADACPFGALLPPVPPVESQERRVARRRLATAVGAVPVLVLLGALGGRISSPALSRVNHTAALAERMWREDHGLVRGVTDASVAYRNTGRPVSELYWRAVQIRKRMDLGATLLGAWIGLVVGLRLTSLARRGARGDYDADPASCLACGRCYNACPVEQERLGLTMTVRLERDA